MHKPYRPILPHRAGYVEARGEYIRVRSEDEIIIKILEQQIETLERLLEAQSASFEQRLAAVTSSPDNSGFTAQDVFDQGPKNPADHGDAAPPENTS